MLNSFIHKWRAQAMKETNENFIKAIGLQPYYGIWVDYGDLDNNCIFETNRRLCRLIADVRQYIMDDEALKAIERKYYPNFFDPKNFIKLIETPLTFNQKKYDSVGDWLRYRNNNTTFTRMDVIESIIECLRKDPHKDEIKEAIRKIDFIAEDLDEVVVDGSNI